MTDETIRFFCQSCGTPLTAPRALQGMTTTCTSCGSQTIVPEAQLRPPPPVQPAPLQAPPAHRSNALAGWSLGLGIASLVSCGCFLGIPAIVLGVMALQRKQDRTLATVGIVLGSLSTLATGVAIPFVLPFLAV